jgi:hypothetical protein
LEFTATVEFVESREDKLKARNRFIPTLLNDSSRDAREDPIVKEQIMRLKVRVEEKDEEIADLQDLCRKFDMGRFRDKIHKKV